MTSSGAADRRTRATAIVCASEAAADPELSLEELLPLVYDELRALAGAYLARERIGHTLQPTALVHEAYLRLVDQTQVRWRGRVHFLAIGARMMRRVLIDYARRRQRGKRGGDRRRVTLPAVAHQQQLDLEDLLALDDALTRLTELSPRQARVVELRYFSGLGVDETARFLGVAKRTVEGDWTHARAWLKRELGPPSD
jgi:RNA polymerase sigma factor (TIGR02999 family)